MKKLNPSVMWMTKRGHDVYRVAGDIIGQPVTISEEMASDLVRNGANLEVEVVPNMLGFDSYPDVEDVKNVGYIA